MRVTLWMNIFLFSTPESTNRVHSPLVLISKSRPPRSPYSTTLSVLLKVVHVTDIEPGTPVKRVTLSRLMKGFSCVSVEDFFVARFVWPIDATDLFSEFSLKIKLVPEQAIVSCHEKAQQVTAQQHRLLARTELQLKTPPDYCPTSESSINT